MYKKLSTRNVRRIGTRIDTGFVSRTAMAFSTGRITGNTKIRVTRKVTRSIIWSVMRNTTSSVARKEEI